MKYMVMNLPSTADIINIKLSIVCSLGWHAKQIISPASSVLIWKGNLGHFEEGQE